MSDRAEGQRLFLVFPFFNEAPNLPRLMGEIAAFAATRPELSIRVLAVDDGSSDGGGEILRSSPGGLEIDLLQNPRNLGPGRSFAAAFRRLSGLLRATDLVATLEADNTSGLETLSRMLVRIREGYDAVLASPYSYGGGFAEVSTSRLLISHLANGLVKIVLGLRGLNTFSSFFRLYRGQSILRLQAAYGPGIIESPGFECMVELLYKMVLLRFSISEVEFRVDWSQRAGVSKMKILRTARGYLRVLSVRGRWAATAPKAGKL